MLKLSAKAVKHGYIYREGEKAGQAATGVVYGKITYVVVLQYSIVRAIDGWLPGYTVLVVKIMTNESFITFFTCLHFRERERKKIFFYVCSKASFYVLSFSLDS